MKILQICNKSPYPPIEGGPIAMNNITCGLLKTGHHVKVLAINSPKYFIETEQINPDYIKKTNYESVFIDTNIKIYKAFFNLFSDKSYNIERFISNDFHDKIKIILSSAEFDIVQIESVYVAPYISTIRKYSNAKIILRTHNIENIIWRRLADNCRNSLKKTYLKHLSRKLKNYENNVFENVDGIAAITKNDERYIIENGCSKPVVTIPVGIVQFEFNEINVQREFPGFFHLGSMNWMPNQEGIKWLLDNVWNKIVAEYPDSVLYLAGRSMPEWLLKYKKQGVIIIGEVENAYDFMKSKSLMLVPLLSGSGMRVKIIEGMACENTIISTSIGAEGINCTNGKNILIADTPDEFVKQMKKCINNPSLCKNIGSKAQNLIKTQYNNDIIINKLINFYKELLHPLQ